MWNVRHYLPLFGFVVPTVAIGYGLVIPRSCIAGVNELTLGFASTILGAALTYVAGIRSATRASCPASTPWRVRLTRFINRQAASPRGPFGRVLGVLWSFEHRRVNRTTLGLLDIAPGHDVLEIGCGPGVALHDAAARAHGGNAIGLDVSDTMVRVASRRNREAIACGRVSIRKSDGVQLKLAQASIDRAFSVHSIYFWSEPERILAQVARALRSGGRLVLAFRPDGTDLPERFRDAVYRFYSPAQVAAMLERAGFSSIQHQADASGHVAWIVAERRDDALRRRDRERLQSCVALAYRASVPCHPEPSVLRIDSAASP